jgi:short-subunit dehydrogenase
MQSLDRLSQPAYYLIDHYETLRTEESDMRMIVDRKRFGPWALITGASAGIGREFAFQIAASGIHLVLVARREGLLKEVGGACSEKFGVEHRIVTADLSEEAFMPRLVEATSDLDIGLVISNAGTGSPGPFLAHERQELVSLLRLNTLPHLELAHHFGRKLVERRSGGILFVGAMGAEKGIPFMANDAGSKSYIRSLALSLHDELEPAGVHVTVLPPGPTDTPVLAKFGFDPKTMPMKPMPVDRCVYEGLRGLEANTPCVIPGRMNRIMNALIPAAMTRAMLRRLFMTALAGKVDIAHATTEAR